MELKWMAGWLTGRCVGWTGEVLSEAGIPTEACVGGRHEPEHHCHCYASDPLLGTDPNLNLPPEHHRLAGFIVTVCSLSHVQLFCDAIDYSSPGSSVHGISQARILERAAIFFPTQGSNSNLLHCRQILFTTKPPVKPPSWIWGHHWGRQLRDNSAS